MESFYIILLIAVVVIIAVFGIVRYHYLKAITYMDTVEKRIDTETQDLKSGEFMKKWPAIVFDKDITINGTLKVGKISKTESASNILSSDSIVVSGNVTAKNFLTG